MNRSWKPDLCNDSTVASEPKVRLKRRKEEVGCVEDKQRWTCGQEKAIEGHNAFIVTLHGEDMYEGTEIDEKGRRKCVRNSRGDAWIRNHRLLKDKCLKKATRSKQRRDKEKQMTSRVMISSSSLERKNQSKAGMIGKVELDDGENATNKKIKKEDELKTLSSITLGG
ncbi:hypothetical protein Tco_0736597 [Tanacetum coccineum]